MYENETNFNIFCPLLRSKLMKA